MMSREIRKTGLDIMGDVPWGTHYCLFYQTKEDLINILVPYFKTGLENNEFCVWVTSIPLSEKEVEKAMRRAVPDFDQYLKRGQIEIVSYDGWYLKDGSFSLQRVLNAWIDKLNQALVKGYDGLRVTGNTFWLKKRDWKSFVDYEAEVDSVIHKYRMIAICTYSIDKCGANEVLDVVSRHRSGLILREGKWEIIKKARRKTTKKRRKPRDLMQIYADILRAASSGALKSRVVSKANINFLRFERILKVMAENGLLTSEPYSPRVWSVTEKGR
ncbi:unnamed protein product, partial [marine sediment metagenome]